MTTPAPVKMWAVVVKTRRTEWIDWGTLGTTQANARKKYSDNWGSVSVAEEHWKSGRVRLAKVQVSVL